MANEIKKFTYYFYKISIDNMCYVGSTKNIKKRMNYHKSDCYNIKSTNYNVKLYKYIRENSGWNNINVQILDVIDNIDKKQAIVFEQQFIEYFENTLNAIRAYATPEQIKQYQKQYNQANKEQIKQYQKQYQQDNKEQIKQQNKQYYENNKEQIKQKTKQYKQDNKEQIKQKYKKKVKCDCCNKEMTQTNLNRHKKKYCKKNKK